MPASDPGSVPGSAAAGGGPGASSARDAASRQDEARSHDTAPSTGTAPADSVLLDQLVSAPFPERIRLVCRAWALQLAPTPLPVMAAYWVKYLVLFVGGWAFFCSFAADYPGLLAARAWAFEADAFHRAIAWAILYESLGFGCGMGPMNGRFWPPLGGFLHFLRPGTTKLALLPGLPLLGGIRRTWLDVALYAAHVAVLLRALTAPEITPALLAPTLVLLPLLGLADVTIFLAARSEHYLVALGCLVLAGGDGPWVAACKLVWIAIWFWAATSKLNDHFPSVIQFMMNNGPFFPRWVKRRLFVDFPEDLRPSRLAVAMARIGAATEYAIPAVLLLASDPLVVAATLVVMVCFHGFIMINNPSGMPIEWNLLMIYGGLFLFGGHPEVRVADLFAQVPWLGALLLVPLVAIPLYGNLVPRHVSFLLAMRYYAGNWAYNIWLVRKDATHRFRSLTKASGTMREQLERMLPDAQDVEKALAMVPAHRFMHFEGRALLEALPHAADDLDAYEWMDGEVVGGMVLGWNFGDGHLNGARLLDAVQRQCGFEPGELRVVEVESQPLFRPRMAWAVRDAASGVLARGVTDLRTMRDEPPDPSGRWAEALRPGR